MRRIVVIGGGGFFGGQIVRKLRNWNYAPLIAGRSGGDLPVDVENRSSVHGVLRSEDLVLDSAGPFQRRSSVLLECALEIGFDLIDISDSYAYAALVYERSKSIEQQGIRVLTSCSVVSAVSAAALRKTGVRAPVRLTAYLAPAGRHTANRATVEALWSSIGHPVCLLRNGAVQPTIGWTETRTLNLPSVGTRRGYLVDSVDALTLPRIWPTLRHVELVVDLQIPGANRLLQSAAHSAPLRRVLEQFMPATIRLTRLLGPAHGALAYQIQADSRQAHYVLTGRRTYLLAVLPAVLAARAILQERFPYRGLIPPDRQLDLAELESEMAGEGITTLVA